MFDGADKWVTRRFVLETWVFCGFTCQQFGKNEQLCQKFPDIKIMWSVSKSCLFIKIRIKTRNFEMIFICQQFVTSFSNDDKKGIP